MTEKIEEEVYRGIHYMQISNLPEDQKNLFKEWLPDDQVIKIMIGKKILPDCVQYHHYQHWYENVLPVQEVAQSDSNDVQDSENNGSGVADGNSNRSEKSGNKSFALKLPFFSFSFLKPSS